VKEFVAAVSRRGGKGRIAGASSAYEAALVHHDLAPGETGIVACISPTRSQSLIVQGYARGYFEASPMLRGEVADVTADEIRLRNGNIICTLAADFRSLRGRTLLLAIIDEAAFLRDEYSSTPDIECARALLPGLATTNGLLMILSSPYRRSGLLHQRHRDYFGKDDDNVLVVTGPSEAFNPTLDRAVIDAAREADPTAAQSEWDGLFRSDIAALLDDESIERSIDHYRPLELPPREGVTYHAFADASAGRHDRFCICIGHKEDQRFVADVIRGVTPPFDPRAIAAEFAMLAKEYRCTRITHDAFAGEWVTAAFKDAGILSERSPLPKSQLYLEMVPAFSRGVVSIPNLSALIRELRLLERRVHRSGKDTVDAPRGISEDHANVLAGAVYLTLGKPSKLEGWKAWGRVDLSPLRMPGVELPGSAVAYAQQRRMLGLW
jgi:hypothetical protein